MKLFYYVRRFGYNALPKAFFRWNYLRLKEFEAHCDQKELLRRLDYYFKVENPFEIPGSAVAVRHFRKTVGTDYYLDLKDFLKYFRPETRFAYHFGDDTHINDYPTIFKARPIGINNKNSILFKLNKVRHFKWVKDPYQFAEKKNLLVWRGGAYLKLRREFVRRFWDHPRCNIGQTNKPKEAVPWQKEFLSIREQLKYKFILSIEGNDVATNLKWIMSSNSLCFMPKPKFETWYMEGTLRPGIHYVELASDYSDLEDKIGYYSENIDESLSIIANAQRYVQQFTDPDLEDLLCLKVLERYANLSGQTGAIRF